MQNGVLAGYEVVDVKVTLYDGSYHEVDSSEMAFKIAGSMAFKEAMRKADPVLTEPIMKVVVIVPEEYMGDVIGDHELPPRSDPVHGSDPAWNPGDHRKRSSFRDVRICNRPSFEDSGPRSLLHGTEPLRRSSEVYLRADHFEESEQLIYLKPNYLLLHFKEEYSNGKS